MSKNFPKLVRHTPLTVVHQVQLDKVIPHLVEGGLQRWGGALHEPSSHDGPQLPVEIHKQPSINVLFFMYEDNANYQRLASEKNLVMSSREDGNGPKRDYYRAVVAYKGLMSNLFHLYFKPWN